MQTVDQIWKWEQSVSSLINELGFSSHPHTHSRKRKRSGKNYTPAGCLLHPLVAVENAFEKLCHQGLEVGVGGLGHHPVCIATQGPAGNRANQGFFVTQTLDKMGDELRQVRHHALHAAWQTEGKSRLEGYTAEFKLNPALRWNHSNSLSFLMRPPVVQVWQSPQTSPCGWGWVWVHLMSPQTVSCYGCQSCHYDLSPARQTMRLNVTHSQPRNVKDVVGFTVSLWQVPKCQWHNDLWEKRTAVKQSRGKYSYHLPMHTHYSLCFCSLASLKFSSPCQERRKGHQKRQTIIRPWRTITNTHQYKVKNKKSIN